MPIFTILNEGLERSYPCVGFKVPHVGGAIIRRVFLISIPARQYKSIMIKSSIAALAASPLLLSGAAFAGPYVNVETNANLTGSNYTDATTDIHIGYEGTAGELGYYVQAGPAVKATDGVDGTDTQFSGKGGVSIAATDSLGLYGEVSFATAKGDTDNGYGAKLGAKWSF